MSLKDKLQQVSDKDHDRVQNEKLKISFSYVDHNNDKFQFHGLDKQFYQQLIDCFQRIKNATAKELKTQTAKSITPKCINWDYSTITEKSFPTHIGTELTKECFEVRITKNNGRVHGFLYNNIFYIVWIDPFHNLFPGKEEIKDCNDYIKVILDASATNSLTKEREELKSQIAKLRKEIEEYEELFQKYGK